MRKIFDTTLHKIAVELEEFQLAGLPLWQVLQGIGGVLGRAGMRHGTKNALRKSVGKKPGGVGKPKKGAPTGGGVKKKPKDTDSNEALFTLDVLDQLNSLANDKVKELLEGVLQAPIDGFENYVSLEARLADILNTTNSDKSKSEATAELDGLLKLGKKHGSSSNDVLAALEQLVDDGTSYEEAKNRLATLLDTSRATGESVTDLAALGGKVSDTYGFDVGNAHKMFEVMLRGDKQGKFDFEDMIKHVPSLANSFKSFGVGGKAGFENLIATLQTVSEGTGTPDEAAAGLKSLMAQLHSSDLKEKFGERGIDLDAIYEQAKANGQNLVHAIAEASGQALGGDFSKVSELFSDFDVQNVIRALGEFREEYEKTRKAIADGKGGLQLDADQGRVENTTKNKRERLGHAAQREKIRAGKLIDQASEPIIDKLLNLIEQDIFIGPPEPRDARSYKNPVRRGSRVAGERTYPRAFSKDELPADGVVRDERLPDTHGDLLKRREEARKRIELRKRFEQQLENLENDDDAGSATPSPISLNGKAPVFGFGSSAELADQLTYLRSQLHYLTSFQSPANQAASIVEDHRQYPTTVNTTINQTVQQPTQAPGAVANAVGAAVAGAVPPNLRSVASSSTAGSVKDLSHICFQATAP